VAALALAAVFAGRGAKTAAQPQISRRPLPQALDRLLVAGAPGAVVLVQNRDETVRLADGYPNVARRTPLDVDDQPHVGTVTKTFVAAIVLQLVGEGSSGSTTLSSAG